MKVTEDGYTELADEWSECEETKFISKNAVYCKLPRQDNYLVVVDNVEGIHSESAISLAVNPECYRCNTTGACWIKV